MLLQLSLYFAGEDITKEFAVTFAGIKCQDELSANHCTACLMAAYLSNDIGPDGEPKKVIPVACENDMDSALTQLMMHLITGKPAGFGDFRDVEKGILYIVNCGQHPPYFFVDLRWTLVRSLTTLSTWGRRTSTTLVGAASEAGLLEATL